MKKALQSLILFSALLSLSLRAAGQAGSDNLPVRRGARGNLDQSLIDYALRSGEASVTLPLVLLYRAQKAGCAFGGTGCANDVYQAGTQAMRLKFEVSTVHASLDPAANAMGLTPRSVTPIQ